MVEESGEGGKALTPLVEGNTLDEDWPYSLIWNGSVAIP